MPLESISRLKAEHGRIHAEEGTRGGRRGDGERESERGIKGEGLRLLIYTQRAREQRQIYRGIPEELSRALAALLPRGHAKYARSLLRQFDPTVEIALWSWTRATLRTVLVYTSDGDQPTGYPRPLSSPCASPSPPPPTASPASSSFRHYIYIQRQTHR